MSSQTQTQDLTILPDSIVRASALPPIVDTHVSRQSYLTEIKVPLVWADYRGSGVMVGVVDDGIAYSHSDLAPNYNHSLDYDFRDNDADAAAVTSIGDRHGTTVAGVIAADDNGSGSVGVAPDAMLAGFRIGFGSATDLSSIARALDLASTTMDIVNNSWSFSTAFSDNFNRTDNPAFAEFDRILSNAVEHGRGGLGTILVFAAGNSGRTAENTNYHNFQNASEVISVGGHFATGVATAGATVLVSADYSVNYVPDVPGSAGFSKSGTVDRSVSGTSFAAPQVSGAVALMLEANPELGWRDVQEILAYSAETQYLPTSPNPSFRINGAGNWNGGGLAFHPTNGFGQLDVRAAVRLAETWTPGKGTSDTLDIAETSAAAALSLRDTATVSQSVRIDQALDIDRIEVDVDLTHARLSDLRITLVSPSGTESLLLDRPGVTSKAPDGILGSGSLTWTFGSVAFWGEESLGSWTLRVQDSRSGESGTLNSWTLRVLGDEVTPDDTYIYTNEFQYYLLEQPRLALKDNEGVDTINFAAVTSDGSVNLANGTATIATRNVTFGSGTVIEHVFGGDGADTLVGNTLANALNGGRGHDTINGGDGDDVVVGGTGHDVLSGGAGIDRVVFRESFDELRFAASSDGILVITRPNTTERDELDGFELFEFSDRTLTQDELRPFVGVLAEPVPTLLRGIVAIDEATGEVIWTDGARTERLGAAPTGSALVGTGDTDSNGSVDLVWQNETTGEVRLWRTDQHLLLSDSVLGIAPTGRTLAGLADVSGDRRDDLIWLPDSGPLSTWTVNGTIRGNDGNLPALKAGSELLAVADVTTPGHKNVADLISVSATGRVEVQQIKKLGNQVTASINLGARPQNSDLLAVTTLSGDTLPDYLWQDRDTGDLTLWVAGWRNGNPTLGSTVTWSPDDDLELLGVSNQDQDAQGELLWRRDGTGDLFIQDIASNGAFSETLLAAGRLDPSLSAIDLQFA